MAEVRLSDLLAVFKSLNPLESEDNWCWNFRDYLVVDLYAVTCYPLRFFTSARYTPTVLPLYNKPQANDNRLETIFLDNTRFFAVT